jgi:DNA-binding NtrC family response regulator
MTNGVLGAVAEATARIEPGRSTCTAGGSYLVVASDERVRSEWAAALAAAGGRVTCAASLRAASDERHASDVIVAHVGRGAAALAGDAPWSRVIAVISSVEQTALSALVKRGVLDILVEPVTAAQIVTSASLSSAQLRPDRRPRTAPEAGGCEAMQLGAAGAAIARTRLPVLILGETGTGKTRLARMLHQTLTPSAPFVEVNAASLGGSLLGSELFGHERGAFTGAHVAKPGLVAAANGGTLFLDEIGELPLDSQAHLLSFLDTGLYRPIGSVRECSSEVRIVCATNRDLHDAVTAGRFREDLYYRLASIVLPLPALRARPQEIPALVGGFLQAASGRTGAPAPELTEEAMALLRGYPWPGNVRQLRFVIERAVAAGTRRIEAADLEPLLRAPVTRLSASPVEVRPLAEVEWEMVCRAMQRAGGNRTKAAALLGITPRGLYNKLRRAGTPFRDPEE